MSRAPYKRSSQKITFLIYFPGKTYMVGILMSICDVCFHGQIRKLSQGHRFESSSRQNSPHHYTALHCKEPFIITLTSSRYDLNNVVGDIIQ